jgi:redox-sensitive bicupin YhaK (pirin superfamily)
MAIYVVEGELMLDGAAALVHTMAALPDNTGATLQAQAAVRLVVIGGDALDGPRFITWNFVSSRRERILEAGADWKAQRMGHVPGETEFIPLPEHPFGNAPPDVKTTPA